MASLNVHGLGGGIVTTGILNLHDQEATVPTGVINPHDPHDIHAKIT